MMGDLPTCWYCPECDQVGGGHKLECYSKTPPSPIKVPMILPGTPLPVILDTLGIPHREGRLDEVDTAADGSGHLHGYYRAIFAEQPPERVLVVDNPATDNTPPPKDQP